MRTKKIVCLFLAVLVFFFFVTLPNIEQTYIFPEQMSEWALIPQHWVIYRNSSYQGKYKISCFFVSISSCSYNIYGTGALICKSPLDDWKLHPYFRTSHPVQVHYHFLQDLFFDCIIYLIVLSMTLNLWE